MILLCVVVMLVQGVLHVTACWMFDYTCPGRTAHDCMSVPNPFLLAYKVFTILVMSGCINRSPKSCLYSPWLKCPKMYYIGECD